MYEVEKNRRILPDGKEITTYSQELVSFNNLKIEAGTTGYMGGDTGHGGRTYFRIADEGGTDIQVHPFGSDGEEGFEVILGGDSELSTIICALKFITKVLEKESKNTHN